MSPDFKKLYDDHAAEMKRLEEKMINRIADLQNYFAALLRARISEAEARMHENRLNSGNPFAPHKAVKEALEAFGVEAGLIDKK